MSKPSEACVAQKEETTDDGPKSVQKKAKNVVFQFLQKANDNIF